ncbi:MAG: hypothetical protein HY585_02280, partial [Candidatus Omnitrophica bacterium]|nr:hypothetical protein [Candidatus Omnitrophota bacterium]
MGTNPGRIFQKVVALGVILTFTSSSTLQSAPISHSVVERDSEVTIDSLARRIEIPDAIASVNGRFVPAQPKAAPVVIHIQDAHANDEAQGNIKETLRYLTKEYGLDLIFREGGIGKIEPGLLKFFKDESLNLKLLDRLAKDGVVGGTELFLMEDEWQGSVFGIEKPELYRENLKAFREVIKKKSGSDRFLQTIKSGILTESSHFLDKKLRAFFHEWLFFQDVPTE